MPIKRGKDKNGTFYMWGDVKGKKYYYTNEQERKEAKQKAITQAIAASYSMAEKCTKKPSTPYCSYERRITHPGSTMKKKK